MLENSIIFRRSKVNVKNANKTIMKEILNVIPRIIIFVIAMCFFAVTKESLTTNYYQHDDACIGDAILLLGINILIIGLFIGKPIKFGKNQDHLVEKDEKVLQ
jgi:predicted Na+-dependent transporter